MSRRAKVNVFLEGILIFVLCVSVVLNLCRVFRAVVEVDQSRFDEEQLGIQLCVGRKTKIYIVVLHLKRSSEPFTSLSKLEQLR